jgi:hypothetical protein
MMNNPAINAKIKALQKEAAAQDRLNRLLDLQYKMSQTLRRNEGESIQDFLERRAQTERGYLSEQRDIEQEVQQEHLQELQEKTQDEVALAELAEQQKNAAAQGGADHRMQLLQKELEASRRHDAAVTKAKLAAIEKQKKAYEEGAEKAAEYATATKNFQIREAISAAHTLGQIAKLSGQVNGLYAAQAFLTALLQTGALRGAEYTMVTEALSRISQTLKNYDNKVDKLAPKVGGKIRLAEGGLIPLRNSSNPFGGNLQFGEQGTEYGLILQHQVAKGLKAAMGKGVGQVGPFYMERAPGDWVKDRYEMKRLVKEAVTEAIGG